VGAIPPLDNVALFFHLLGALLFVAGIVLAGAAFETARGRQRPAEIAVLLGLTRIGVLLVAVGGLLLPIFGLWLVHLGNFGYGSAWGDAAIVLYLVARSSSAASAESDPSRPVSSRPRSPNGALLLATSCMRCSTTPSRARRTTPRCCS
jgi:Predicted integral membrane protein (DUF2269)